MSGNIYKRPGTNLYWIQYRNADGKRIRQSTGEADPGRAREALAKALERRGELTFVDAVENFFRTKQIRDTTAYGYRNSLRVLDPYFRKHTLAEITLSDIKAFVAKRRTVVSDASVRRDVQFLSSVISHSQDTLSNAPEVNIVKSYSKRHLKEVKRNRWLTVEEFKRLENACTQEWHRMVLLLAVNTGMRHGELRMLQKSWVDFGGRRIHVPGEYAKGGRPRTVLIPVQIVDTVQEYCARVQGEYLFGGSHPFTSFQGFFRAACLRAGIKNMRFHDLRHTFASWWVLRDGDIYPLQKLLGHSSVQVTERYAHLATHSLGPKVDQNFGHSLGTLEKKP